MTDRFNDGDPSNNGNNLPPGQLNDQNANNLYNENNFRQGGDLAGITQRLDYIADLGASVIWMTPIAKHDGSYHGYCTTDPTVIDPGFGTNADFQLLVNEAHKRGIKEMFSLAQHNKVVMDIVVNHLCDPASYYSSYTNNHGDCAQSLWDASWSGSPSAGRNRGTLHFSPSFFGPLQSQDFFGRCGSNSGDDTTGSGPAAVFGDFTAGFFDYDTRNYDFQDVFTEIHKYWIAFADIDGYRLDAAKHVTEDFIAHFSTNIRAYASSLGKNNFFTVGEVAADVQWQGRRMGNMFHDLNNLSNHGTVPASLTYKIGLLQSTFKAHPVNKYPGLDSIYNFELGGTARTMILGGATSYDSQATRIGDYFSGDFKTVAFDGVDLKNAWVPLEIHDWPRLLHNNLLNPSVVAYARSNGNGGKALDFGPGGLNLNQRGYALFVPASVVGGFDSYYGTNLCTH
ncbi:hypothetical protein HDU76_011876 [Blyttiomyces sp. JEL0837]|nr:hypothetical protein HDU76_011876 [Blyttiomyces sp. JEL0837]